MKFKVAIVDDDPRFRAQLAHAVMREPDMHLVGAADDVGSAMALLGTATPDVLLVDLNLPSGSGIEVIRRAAQWLSGCDIMVISAFGDERSVWASLNAGASGYLLKDCLEQDLGHHIRSLRSGGSPVSPLIARKLVQRLARPGAPAAEGPAAPAEDDEEVVLSERERTVLTNCAKGYTYPEIAAKLGLSPHSVGTYVKRAYRKLQAKNKMEAVQEARKRGLLGP